MATQSSTQLECRSLSLPEIGTLSLVGALEPVKRRNSIHWSLGLPEHKCSSQESVLYEDKTCQSQETAVAIQVEPLNHGSCPLCRLICARLPEFRRSFGQEWPSPILAVSMHLHDWRTLASIYIRGRDGKRYGTIRLVSDQKSSRIVRERDNSAARITGQVRGWLDNCERCHGPTCNLGNFATARYRLPIEITLIDVEHQCLVESYSDSRFVALSYVWGATAMCTALNKNFIPLHKPGSLSVCENLPTVVKDAMQLVKELGERYLWVDRLCIVQDSATKHQHLAQMDVIFSHALLTIAAVDGADANTSLPGVGGRSSSPAIICETLSGQAYISEPPSLQSVLHDSVYESRGWTLQERALSRRVLYITDLQIYFQCNVSIRSESHPHEKKRKTVDQHTNWTIGQRLNEIRLKGPVNEKLLADILFGEEAARESWLQGQMKKSWIMELPTYQDLVEVYSARKLSYPSDVLNAFAGFSSVFEECCGGPIVFGLPVRVLGIALLWSRKEPQRSAIRRIAVNGSILPSWSWAGWLGPIKYWSLIRCSNNSTSNLYSRLEDIELFVQTTTVGSTKDQDISQTNEPNISIHHYSSKRLTRKINILKFCAPVVSCMHFTFLLDSRHASSGHMSILSKSNSNELCGIIFDLSSEDMNNFSTMYFILISHDFDPLRRAQLRSTYGIPTLKTATGKQNPHTLNLLLVKKVEDHYERLAVAKMYSEAWPRRRKGDQRRRVVLR